MLCHTSRSRWRRRCARKSCKRLALNYIARRAVATCRALDPTLVNYQRVRMKRLHEAINDAGGYEADDLCDLKPHLYFPQNDIELRKYSSMCRFLPSFDVWMVLRNPALLL
jgi:hypothetical protein